MTDQSLNSVKLKEQKNKCVRENVFLNWVVVGLVVSVGGVQNDRRTGSNRRSCEAEKN